MATPDGVRKSLFGSGRFEKSRRFSDAANQPPRADQKVDWILKECGLISFDCMPNELQNPAADEECQRDPPIEKEEQPRNSNHRDAKRMTKLIHRVPMLGFVIFDKGVHETSKS
jgi:hypothetical protein